MSKIKHILTNLMLVLAFITSFLAIFTMLVFLYVEYVR